MGCKCGELQGKQRGGGRATSLSHHSAAKQHWEAPKKTPKAERLIWGKQKSLQLWRLHLPLEIIAAKPCVWLFPLFFLSNSCFYRWWGNGSLKLLQATDVLLLLGPASSEHPQMPLLPLFQRVEDSFQGFWDLKNIYTAQNKSCLCWYTKRIHFVIILLWKSNWLDVSQAGWAKCWCDRKSRNEGVERGWTGTEKGNED